MPVRYVWFINFMLILLLKLPTYLSDTKTKPTSGPYKASIVSISECAKPDRPYMKQPTITLKMALINDSNNMLITGNATVMQDTKNVKVKIKCSIWENGHWVQYLLIKDLGCHGMLVNLLVIASGVSYDRRDCTMKKGKFTIKPMDVNAVQHMITSKMVYGRMMWRSEIYDPWKGTHYCYDFETLSEPA